MDPDTMSPELILACAKRDISAIFRILNRSGIPQRRIAELVRMSQSEVSEILKGRQVQAYDVMERVCEGLEIPRGMMGLAYDEDYEPGSPSEPVREVDDEMKRRGLFAVATTALFGSPVLGEVLELPRPVTPTPLPKRLNASDVEAIRRLTVSLQDLARQYGGYAEMIGHVANRSRKLLTIPATDKVKAELSVALAELHTMAGWCCVDGGFSDQAQTYFATAMDLGDSHQVAWSLRHAGIQMVDDGDWNNALKAFQLASLGTTNPELLACLEIESAVPYAGLGHKDMALDALKRGYDRPQTDIFDAADMDNVASSVHSMLGSLTSAEVFARASLDKWTRCPANRDRVEAEITLATVHLRSGELNDGTLIARRAITNIAPLQSVRARNRLLPLEQALLARKDSTCQNLARIVRKVRVA